MKMQFIIQKEVHWFFLFLFCFWEDIYSMDYTQNHKVVEHRIFPCSSAYQDVYAGVYGDNYPLWSLTYPDTSMHCSGDCLIYHIKILFPLQNLAKIRIAALNPFCSRVTKQAYSEIQLNPPGLQACLTAEKKSQLQAGFQKYDHFHVILWTGQIRYQQNWSKASITHFSSVFQDLCKHRNITMHLVLFFSCLL